MSHVQVGDRQFEITAFSGYKFLEATELLAQMLEVVPGLDTEMAKFARDWREANPPRTIDRATAELEFGGQVVSDEAWDQVGGKLTLTPRADGTRIFLRLYPMIHKHARADMELLLALCITPNSELEQAEGEGADIYAPDGPVGKMRRHLLHKGSLTQLVKVALAALESLGEEIQEGDLVGEVGKLRDRWEEITTTPDSEESKGQSDEPAAKPRPKNRAQRRRSSGGPRSSTTSSSSTPAASPEPKSSTASPTAS